MKAPCSITVSVQLGEGGDVSKDVDQVSQISATSTVVPSDVPSDLLADMVSFAYDDLSQSPEGEALCKDAGKVLTKNPGFLEAMEFSMTATNKVLDKMAEDVAPELVMLSPEYRADLEATKKELLNLCKVIRDVNPDITRYVGFYDDCLGSFLTMRDIVEHEPDDGALQAEMKTAGEALKNISAKSELSASIKEQMSNISYSGQALVTNVGLRRMKLEAWKAEEMKKQQAAVERAQERVRALDQDLERLKQEAKSAGRAQTNLAEEMVKKKKEAADAEEARKKAEDEKHKIENARFYSGSVGLGILACVAVIALTGGGAALVGAAVCPYLLGGAACIGGAAVGVGVAKSRDCAVKKAELDEATKKEAEARIAVATKKKVHANATRQSQEAAAKFKAVRDELRRVEAEKQVREQQAAELQRQLSGADQQLQAAEEVGTRYCLLFKDMNDVLGDLTVFGQNMQAMQDQAATSLKLPGEGPGSKYKFERFKDRLKDFDTETLMEQSQLARKLNKLNLSIFNKVVDATVTFNYGKKDEIAA